MRLLSRYIPIALLATLLCGGALAAVVETVQGYLRSVDSDYVRYYHLSSASFDPGASGATWTAPDANTMGGWYLNAAGEILILGSDIHNDWDGASNVVIEVYFCVSDGTTVNTDTADLQIISYYMGAGDSGTKTQTDEIATVTDGTQWKQYKAEFEIAYDAGARS